MKNILYFGDLGCSGILEFKRNYRGHDYEIISLGGNPISVNVSLQEPSKATKVGWFYNDNGKGKKWSIEEIEKEVHAYIDSIC